MINAAMYKMIIHFTRDVIFAFDSVRHIIRDVNYAALEYQKFGKFFEKSNKSNCKI